MNVAGVEVQRHLDRSVRNSMHGIWSPAAVVGGLTLSGAAAVDLSLPLHLSAVAAPCGLKALIAARWVPNVTANHRCRRAPLRAQHWGAVLLGRGGQSDGDARCCGVPLPQSGAGRLLPNPPI